MDVQHILADHSALSQRVAGIEGRLSAMESKWSTQDKWNKDVDREIAQLSGKPLPLAPPSSLSGVVSALPPGTTMGGWQPPSFPGPPYW